MYIVVDKDNLIKWMKFELFFRYIKFRLREFDSDLEEKKFMYTKFVEIYKRDYYKKSKILFKKLDSNKERILEIIFKDLNTIQLNQYIKLWYRDFICSF